MVDGVNGGGVAAAPRILRVDFEDSPIQLGRERIRGGFRGEMGAITRKNPSFEFANTLGSLSIVESIGVKMNILFVSDGGEEWIAVGGRFGRQWKGGKSVGE